MTIPFNTGIPSLLKEKGFDVKTEKYFNTIENDTAIMQSTYKVNFNGIRAHTSHTSAPDYDQVLDWLQQNYKMYLSARVDTVTDRDSIKWYYIFDYNVQRISKSIYPTRYEAINVGILEALKLIKN